MSELRRTRGFVPYLAVVFLNAFVDLGHKIVIQNTIFKIYAGQEQIALTAVVNALILLPFILLFSPAGFLADRFARQRVIRHAALAAVAATLAITACYYGGSFHLAFGLTLALAVQSAIYSPAKYGYIKELVGKEGLAAANGVVQAVTIGGILLGTFVFSILFEFLLARSPGWDAAEAEPAAAVLRAVAPIGWLLVGLSVVEWLVSARLPARRAADSSQRFALTAYLRLHYLRRNLLTLGENRAIWLSIVGLATFWAISQVMLAAFPAFAKAVLALDNTVVIQGLLACSGIGIALGSVIAGRASRNYIETGLIPLGALGIALGLALLPLQHSAFGMGLLFLLVGVMGGLFIVPLNALIQFQAPEEHLGTILAGNNWVQNVAMLGALAVTLGVALGGVGSVGLFHGLALVALLGTGYTVKQLPHSFARLLANALLRRRYNVEVVGFEHLPRTGPTLLLGNHISWIDWALVQIACPRPVRFVMLRRIYETWYLKPFFRALGVVPIAAGQSEDSLATINGLLRAGECVCLFPEGSISRNGQLGKFHTGYQRTVAGVEGGVIVPFYLHGLWGSSFSRAEEGLREARVPALHRDLIVAFGPPLPLDTRANVLKQRVFDLSLDAWAAFAATLPPLPETFIRTARRQPGATALIDSAGERLSYRQLYRAVLRCAAALERQGIAGRIGVALPCGSEAAIATLAVLWQGGTAVPLDPADPGAATAPLAAVIGRGAPPADVAAPWLAIDDLRSARPGWRRVVAGLSPGLLPARKLHRLSGRVAEADAIAAILAAPGGRGVQLSHRSLLVNSRQISDVLNMRSDDLLLCALSPQHAFGFTVGLLMPLLEGVPVVCHADGDDATGIARSIARYRVTVVPGEPVLLQRLTAEAGVHPLMLESLRALVSGVAPLPAAQREAFELRFGCPVYEGYGVTEASPVVSVNVPDAMDTRDWQVQVGRRPGTVGLPLPGTSVRIVDPGSLAEKPPGENGLILATGGQLMAGYLDDPAATAAAFRELDGRRWLVTGDRGHLTADGFLVLESGTVAVEGGGDTDRQAVA
jgi:acyl-[acyl-carrier-protein]-phospholipid O-acyltransferase/long-chain-fatty-acid--[acyl-carrier-protein] ligase